jgi:hypothetical protein
MTLLRCQGLLARRDWADYLYSVRATREDGGTTLPCCRLLHLLPRVGLPHLLLCRTMHLEHLECS